MPQQKSKLPIVVLSLVNLILVLGGCAIKLYPVLESGGGLAPLDIADLCVDVGCAFVFFISCLLINKAPALNFIPEAIQVAYYIGWMVYRSFYQGVISGDYFVYGIIYVGFVIVYGLAMSGKFGYSVAGRVLIIIFGILRMGYVTVGGIRMLSYIKYMEDAQVISTVLRPVRGILIAITMIMCVFYAAKRRPKAAPAAPVAAAAQPQAYAQPAPPPYPVEADESSFGYAVLCFFFPLVGLILFLVWKDTTPLKAKSCGIGALIGFIVSVVLSILSTVLYVLLFMAVLH